jgi:PAS domain S-box-containing protein
MVESIQVLHVGDDTSVADLTASFSERNASRLDVVSETNAVDGLDRLARGTFDCIVSDYRIPGPNGLKFLRSVREHYGNLPFILFTNSGSEDVASEAISAGVTNYVRKGTGAAVYDDLAEQIRDTVDRRRAVDPLETFLDAAPDATLVTRTDGRIEYVNERVEELFGYDRSDLLTAPIEKLIPDRFCEDHVDYREAYAADPESRPMGRDVDLYGRHADGSEFPVDVAISPINLDGRTGIVAAVRDISTRKWREEQLREREAELEERNQRLEAFAGVVSHDLRNPLNLATGKLSLARAECDCPHLEQIADAHERMDSMIADLLTLARDGKRPDDVTAVDLATTVDRCWDMVETLDATRVVDVDCTIRADETRLKQLLENLFRNAVEHGGSDVTVTVGELPDGFFVEDDGVGIPDDIRHDVFEPGSTSADGTGLGLDIVHRVAEGHDWDVAAAESDAGGGRFEITGVELQ